MDFIRDCYEGAVYTITSKIFRVFTMFILTISTATIEIICGVRSHSGALIADGLYSFAEGICLIGVLIVLYLAEKDRFGQKRNTFGHERLELLIGLLQEVFLLSLSLGIIVDAINHILHPGHVHDPDLMIIVGGIGILVGMLGMFMFWGYHHTHNIEEEIHERHKSIIPSELAKRLDGGKQMKKAAPPIHIEGETDPTGNESDVDLPADVSNKLQPTENEAAQTLLLAERKLSNSSQNSFLKTIKAKNPLNASQRHLAALSTFTYENVQIGESKIYATLHALCLHSFVVLLESVIVSSSGLLIKLVPHIDPVTGKEINGWLKYIDPALTLLMVVIIAIQAIPVIFSISAILIENVPAGIDTQVLMKEIVAGVPAIKSIHSFHIWRATSTEIYAMLHLVCDEDASLSTCSNQYSEAIKKILKSYCIRYFTLQFEYIKSDQSSSIQNYRCVHGLHRRRRGHTLEQSVIKLAKDAMINIH